VSGRDFLGTGWRFPLRPGAHGGFAWSSAEQDIQESIWIILGTARGERQMLPRFGCGIHGYVFSPNSPSTRASIAEDVRNALTTWEPRIDLTGVAVDGTPDDPARLLVRIDYRVKKTNAFHNLVYPFYLQEGKES
jgi:phage baseplate assembly protein W